MNKKRTKTTKRTKRAASKKAVYRVKNWAAYNASLVQRGAVTFWFSEEVLAGWHPAVEGPRRRGGQVKYSDQAIECMLMLKAVYQLPYRQTEGFGQSLLDLMGLALTAPDYTTLCKRSVDLPVALPLEASDEPKHIVMDSTGLKVYGEGEWKVRQHGYSKHRTWRKLHLSLDAATQGIQAVVLTGAGGTDAAAGVELLEATPGPIEQVSGDGSYDKRKFYDACILREVDHIAVPPQRNARIWQHGNSTKKPHAVGGECAAWCGHPTHFRAGDCQITGESEGVNGPKCAGRKVPNSLRKWVSQEPAWCWTRSTSCSSCWRPWARKLAPVMTMTSA